MITHASHLLTNTLRAAGLLLALSAAACSGGGDDGQTSGCTPGASTGCPSGQLCSADGTCQPTGGTPGTLVIDSASARACEILLESPSTRVLRATYGAGVKGAMRSRAPRVAIAVASATDASFAGDAIQLELDGATSDVRVAQVDCYDASGAALSSASATVR